MIPADKLCALEPQRGTVPAPQDSHVHEITLLIKLCRIWYDLSGGLHDLYRTGTALGGEAEEWVANLEQNPEAPAQTVTDLVDAIDYLTERLTVGLATVLRVVGTKKD